MKHYGRINRLLVRSDDVLIDYINDAHPTASGHQILIGLDELLSTPSTGSVICVETDYTNSVIRVEVDDLEILNRLT